MGNSRPFWIRQVDVYKRQTYYVVSGFENNVFTASNVTLAKTNNAVYVVDVYKRQLLII